MTAKKGHSSAHAVGSTRGKATSSAAAPARRIAEAARTGTTTRDIAKKISITIDHDAHEWISALAKREAKPLSALMTEAIRSFRRERARDRVLDYLGDAANLTDADRARIAAEWA